MRHDGSLDTIAAAVREMNRSVLAGRERAPRFSLRLSLQKCMPYVTEHEQVKDVYLPVQ